MSVIRLAGFSGENRALHPKLLPETVGTTSLNQKPGRGDLRPWKTPLTVATVPGGRSTIYRMGRDVASDAQYWMTWTGTVHAVRGFDAADTTERTFYTGDSTPKVTDSTMALASAPFPTANRPMGLPAPVGAPSVSAVAPSNTTTTNVKALVMAGVASGVATFYTAGPHGFVVGDTVSVAASAGPSGSFIVIGTPDSTSFTVDTAAADLAPTVSIGTATVVTNVDQPDPETYFYVYTYVNDWGWESAPSPVSAELTRPPTGTTDIGGFSTAPAGNYNINRMRIYRTQAGSSGSADFFFLREVPYPTGSTTDDNRTLGEVCPVTTWLPTPGLPIGAGVATPEPTLTSLTAMWNGMLAGISGNSVRFCEAYVPYAWPVAYDVVPPDGKPVALGVFGQNLLVLTTGRPLLVAGSSPDSMDQQPLEIPQACIAPKSAVSMGFGVAWASNDGLMFYGSGGAKVLTAGLLTRDDWQAMNPVTMVGCMYEGLYMGSYEQGGFRKGFLIDPANPQGIFFLDVGYQAMHFDELQDQLYVLDGTAVKRWDAGTAMAYTFKSKLFRQTRPTSFAAVEVVADAYPVTFKVWSDGALRHTQSVTSKNPFRLPSGMGSDWQIEVIGTHPVQAVVMASSMAELAQA